MLPTWEVNFDAESPAISLQSRADDYDRFFPEYFHNVVTHEKPNAEFILLMLVASGWRGIYPKV